VDFISEVNLTRDGTEISGVADVVVCAQDLEQAAHLIGSPMLSEAQEWAYTESDYQTEIKKLKDEVFAWQQRLLNLANLTPADFAALLQIESASKAQTTPTPTPPAPSATP